jgi:hypothetical protein
MQHCVFRRFVFDSARGKATMNNQQQPVTVYQVRVGHSEVIVKASSSQEAIDVARRKLALEMPLLYDIIRALDATRFNVFETA